MKTVAELRQERAQAVEGAQGIIAQADTEDRALTDDEKQQIDELEARAVTLGEDIERRERLDRMAADAAPTRPAQRDMSYHPTRTTPDTADALFSRWIKQPPGRDDSVLAEEYRAASMVETRASNDTTMNITTDADGGYLVPTGHFQGIVERARPRALPFLLDIQNIPGRGTTVNVPVDNEADTGVFVSTTESNAFDRDAPALSQVAMTLVMYTKKVDLTYQLLDDEDSRLMQFLEGYVGAGYAATLNNLMVTEALADGTAALTLDSATVIAASEIPELYYKLSAEYARGNIAWLVARATEGEIYALASSSVYTFTNTPGGNAMGQASLWGAPLYTDANMGATAASAKSMLIADWGYMGMRLSPGMTLVRDPYTRSSYGEVILNYHFRADFEVLQAGAFQYATHPTA